MTWETYYEKFYEWADSTQVTNMSKLENLGPSEEICEIAQAFYEEKHATRLVKKALAAGVRFTADEVVELDGLLDEALMPTLIKTARTPFDAEDLDNLSSYLEARDLRAVASKSGVKIDADGYVELEPDSTDGSLEQLMDDLDAMEATLDAINQQEARRKAKPGFGTFLLAAIAAFGKSSSAKEDRHTSPHNGRCDGDCANCPPHYGYRYGRWYYGRHHHYGCQFGGNHGGGGLD